jgi:hypothetical protein
MYTYSTNGLKVGRGLVLKIVGVLDLARSPDTLVCGVVNERGGPLALVFGVLLHGRLPLAATRNLVTLGVGNSRWDPVTILLIIPIFRLLSLWVGNGGGLVLEPILRLGSFLIDNLERRLLIPVFRLLSLRISDAGLVNPVLRLLVLGVVNLLVRVDRGAKVLEQCAVADGLAINLNFKAVVGLHDKGVESSGLDDAGHWRVLEVLLLVLASLGVLVAEDEVDLQRLDG